MTASANDQGICTLKFTDEVANLQCDNKCLQQLEIELKEYFNGKRKEFSVALAPTIGTSFQINVWSVLGQIPYGNAISYLQEAMVLGRASAVRAVANANGKNPIAILIPCHRVISSSGAIGGYNGGIWRKKFLLDLEKRF